MHRRSLEGKLCRNVNVDRTLMKTGFKLSGFSLDSNVDLICCQTFSHEIDRFPSTVHRDSAAHQGEEVKTDLSF